MLKQSICLFVFIFILFHLDFARGQEEGRDLAKSVFRQMSTYQPKTVISNDITISTTDYPLDCNFVDDDMGTYWKEVSDECQNIFIDGLNKSKKINQVDSFANEYVSCFGKDGAVADMRLVLGCPVLATQVYSLLSRPKEPFFYSDTFTEFALHYNVSIVQNMMKSKKFYKRIHWLILWAGERPFTHGNKDSSFDDFLYFTEQINRLSVERKWNENNYEYWYCVRFYLSLVYLCGQEDKIAGYPNPLTPSNMAEIKENLSSSLILRTTHIVYDSREAQYRVVPEMRFPSIELPTTPFPEIKYETFPRISRTLIRLFNENFCNRIIEKR